jgi:hypothetical protein
MNTYELLRYMQYCLEKAMERPVPFTSGYTGAIALVVESGVLYATSQVSEICIIEF